MGMFSETVVENREFSVVQDQSRLFTTHSKLFTAFLDCPRQHARHMQRCEHMCVVCTGVYVCRSPQCVQGSVCRQRSILWQGGMCRYLRCMKKCLYACIGMSLGWCVELSMACTVTPMLCADTTYAFTGIHTMVCGQFSPVKHSGTCCIFALADPPSLAGFPSYRYTDLVCMTETILFPG